MDILSYVLGYNKGKAQGGGGTAETDIFPLQTVSGFVEDTELLLGSYYAYVPTFEIKEGETYYVKWEGETYTCKGIAVSYEGLNFVYIGNGSMLGYPSNNEPFAAIYMVALGKTEFVSFTSTENSHDVRVYQIASGSADIEIKPLTVTKNGTYTAPAGEAYSPVTVSVPSNGSIDFPYDLKEIFPETEVTFKLGDSTYFPTTPTFVFADEEELKSMEAFKSGDGVLVLWDGKIYPGYAGSKNTPPLIAEEGSNVMVMGIGPSVGNTASFDAYQPFSTMKLVKPDKTTFAPAEVQNLATAGYNSDPFFIVANSTVGYVFCANCNAEVWFGTIHTFMGETKANQYNGLFVGMGTHEYGTSKRFSPGTIYPVRYKNDIYYCEAIATNIEVNGETKVITYVGNAKSFGGEDNGEPFAIIQGLVDSTVFVSINRYGSLEDPFHCNITVYPPEIKHTVQMFKFVK